MNGYFSPSEKSKTCQGLSRSISSQDFGNSALWDFILSEQTLLWQQKQVLSSHAIKARNFPCLHTPVCGRNKQAERVDRLPHWHNRPLPLPPATHETFFPAFATGLSLSQPAISAEALDSEGTFRAGVTLLNRPKGSLRGTRHVSITPQSRGYSRSGSALCVREENGERKWEVVEKQKRKKKSAAPELLPVFYWQEM